MNQKKYTISAHRLVVEAYTFLFLHPLFTISYSLALGVMTFFTYIAKLPLALWPESAHNSSGSVLKLLHSLLSREVSFGIFSLNIVLFGIFFIMQAVVGMAVFYIQATLRKENVSLTQLFLRYVKTCIHAPWIFFVFLQHALSGSLFYTTYTFYVNMLLIFIAMIIGIMFTYVNQLLYDKHYSFLSVIELSWHYFKRGFWLYLESFIHWFLYGIMLFLPAFLCFWFIPVLMPLIFLIAPIFNIYGALTGLIVYNLIYINLREEY